MNPVHVHVTGDDNVTGIVPDIPTLLDLVTRLRASVQHETISVADARELTASAILLGSLLRAHGGIPWRDTAETIQSILGVRETTPLAQRLKLRDALSYWQRFLATLAR